MNAANDDAKGGAAPAPPFPGTADSCGVEEGSPAERPWRLGAGQKVPVLLVEDSPLISRSLIDLIEEDGRCRVIHVVETENDAVSVLATGSCCIAVIDLQLKQGSGLGVLGFLHHRADRPLTIVLTNFARPEIRAQCQALGAHHFFDKSREFDRVMPAIETFLETRTDD
ncbi:MAG: response regulator [Burkholderiales bacterium]